MRALGARMQVAQDFKLVGGRGRRLVGGQRRGRQHEADQCKPGCRLPGQPGYRLPAHEGAMLSWGPDERNFGGTTAADCRPPASAP